MAKLAGRLHAEQESGELESSDQPLVQRQGQDERRRHNAEVLDEQGSWPADDDPGDGHDDGLVEEIERQHGLVGVGGDALPSRPVRW